MLAGGRSRRYGGDKLRARVDGRPSLARVLAAVRPLAGEVIVATSSERRRRELARLLPATTHFSVDRADRRWKGPAGAIAQALEELPVGPVLFVPGDMPWLSTAVVRRFLRLANPSAAAVAVVCWPSGETEHLMQWHRGRDALRALPHTGTPRGRASEFLRAASTTLLVPVPVLTSDPRRLLHLTRPIDRTQPAPRGGAGPWTRPRTIGGRPKEMYRAAHALLARGRRAGAARAFGAEAAWYSAATLPILARHALDDAERATRRVPAPPGTVNRPARAPARR